MQDRRDGATALHIASLEGNLEMVRALLSHGADLRPTAHGPPPLLHGPLTAQPASPCCTVPKAQLANPMPSRDMLLTNTSARGPGALTRMALLLSGTMYVYVRICQVP